MIACNIDAHFFASSSRAALLIEAPCRLWVVNQPCRNVTTATGTSATVATTELENATIAAASENAATAVSRPRLTIPTGANGAGTEMGSSPRSFVPTAPWPTHAAFATRWAVGAACLRSITRAVATPNWSTNCWGNGTPVVGRPTECCGSYFCDKGDPSCDSKHHTKKLECGHIGCNMYPEPFFFRQGGLSNLRQDYG